MGILPWVCGVSGCGTTIIRMTTRSLPAEQGMSLRSNRRLPALPPVVPVPPASSSLSLCSAPSDRIAEELGPRLQGDSTSPQSNPVPEAAERPERTEQVERVERPVPRVTRSRANSLRSEGVAALQGMAEEAVAGREDVLLAKRERERESGSVGKAPPVEQASSLQLPPAVALKKSAQKHSASSQQLPPPQPTLPATAVPSSIPTNAASSAITTATTSSSPSSAVFSPYGNFRKSYRKFRKGEVVSFPYRKCHQPLEGRIVAALNKLASERECRKEVEGLADRVARASTKEMRSRFVVAGLRMVLRLARERTRQGEAGVEGRLMARLQGEEKALQARIASELEDFSMFEEAPPPPSSLPDPRAASYRGLVMKKLYSFLKRGRGQCKGEIRRRVVSECQGFFAGEVSVDEMLKFVRTRLEG